MMNVVDSRFVIVLLCVCGRYDLAWAHSSRSARAFHNDSAGEAAGGAGAFYTRCRFFHKIQLSAVCWRVLPVSGGRFGGAGRRFCFVRLSHVARHEYLRPVAGDFQSW